MTPANAEQPNVKFTNIFFILKSFHLYVVVSVLICILLSIGVDIFMNDDNDQLPNHKFFLLLSVLRYTYYGTDSNEKLLLLSRLRIIFHI